MSDVTSELTGAGRAAPAEAGEGAAEGGGQIGQGEEKGGSPKTQRGARKGEKGEKGKRRT